MLAKSPLSLKEAGTNAPPGAKSMHRINWQLNDLLQTPKNE